MSDRIASMLGWQTTHHSFVGLAAREWAWAVREWHDLRWILPPGSVAFLMFGCGLVSCDSELCQSSMA